jgi:hypothetical protein
LAHGPAVRRAVEPSALGALLGAYRSFEALSNGRRRPMRAFGGTSPWRSGGAAARSPSGHSSSFVLALDDRRVVAHRRRGHGRLGRRRPDMVRPGSALGRRRGAGSPTSAAPPVDDGRETAFRIISVMERQRSPEFQTGVARIGAGHRELARRGFESASTTCPAAQRKRSPRSCVTAARFACAPTRDYAAVCDGGSHGGAFGAPRAREQRRVGRHVETLTRPRDDAIASNLTFTSQRGARPPPEPWVDREHRLAAR